MLVRYKELNVTLNELKFSNYQTKSYTTFFKLVKIPPTDGAAKQGCYMVYLQLQKLRGIDEKATKWTGR